MEGWDTANKLVIIANSILRQPGTLADVEPVIGITDITPEQIGDGARRGVRSSSWSPRPTLDRRQRYPPAPSSPNGCPQDDFLASSTAGRWASSSTPTSWALQQLKVDERGPVPTAAAMLRDVINLATAID